MEFGADTGRMREDKEYLEDRWNDICRSMELLITIGHKLSQIWEGEGSNAFFNAYGQDLQKLMEAEDILNHAIEYLQEKIVEYEDCEEKIHQLIQET